MTLTDHASGGIMKVLCCFFAFCAVVAATACAGNGARSGTTDYRKARAADIQKKIDRLRCDFAAVVVENQYRDSVFLYKLSYSGEVSAASLGGSVFPFGGVEVFCILSSDLKSNGAFLLRAQTTRGTFNIRDVVESEPLQVRQGDVWRATVGGAFTGLNNIAYLRERGVSVRKLDDLKSK